jgi:Na+-transporting NADH:ubiquinone oxidoreductase subunit C
VSNDSVGKTFAVAIAVAVSCSLLVSIAAVGLQGFQEANRALERKRNIVVVADLDQPGTPIEEIFQRVERRIVDLDTGEYVTAGQQGSPSEEDLLAQTDPAKGQVVPRDQDIARIQKREQYAVVYLVRDGDRLDQVVLPVRGKGLWSTLYGYVALDSDLETVRGLTFYEHMETPGLGGEIDNPDWKALWDGKKIYDDTGQVRIRVVKGSVDPQKAAAEYQVDGLSGATLTANGVTNMMRYWFGDSGFGPYLERLKQEGGLHG